MKKMNMLDYWLRIVKDNYVNFNGRDTLPQYWWFVLMNFIISIVVSIIATVINVPILANIVSLAFLLPSLGAAVRRMHDVGKSGWFILIPIYNIILLATEGQSLTNEYGPDPRNNSNSDYDFENQQFQK